MTNFVFEIDQSYLVLTLDDFYDFIDSHKDIVEPFGVFDSVNGNNPCIEVHQIVSVTPFLLGQYNKMGKIILTSTKRKNNFSNFEKLSKIFKYRTVI